MRILFFALCALILTACGGEPAACEESEPFQAARQGAPLEVPDDLARPTPTGKFEIPDAGRNRVVRGPCGDRPPLRVAAAPDAPKPAAPAVPPSDLPAPPTNEVPTAEEKVGADSEDEEAATFQAPVATVAAAGAPPLTGNVEEDVRNTMIVWLTAWARGDGEAMVSFYSKDFEPSGIGQTREDWAAERIATLEESGPTDVRGDRLTVDESYAGASARFIQEFHDRGKIDAVIKRIDFVVEDGRWMIIRERILEVL